MILAEFKDILAVSISEILTLYEKEVLSYIKIRLVRKFIKSNFKKDTYFACNS